MHGHIRVVDGDRKPQRVRQKDLQAIQQKHAEGKDKRVPVWYRPAPKESLVPLGLEVSRSAAILFSEVWKQQLESSPNLLVLEDIDVEPSKHIINWINMCVEEGNDVKFPDISEDENQLNVLIEIIVTANYLKIPELSLQAGLKKRAPVYARKHIIDMEIVERIYDYDSLLYTDDLQEIAAISMFEAWWTKKLDQPEYDDYTSFLEQMRACYPNMDEDLRKQFQKKKDFIEGKREEKKHQASAAMAGAGMGVEDGWDSVEIQPAEVAVGSALEPLQVDGTSEASGNNWNKAEAAVPAEGTSTW